ncbi:tRNA pseudouridine(38-40) synthase TruA [Candidatus Omnitrophota bacterium]
MRNIKLTIQYQGTRYNGWQVQRKQKTSKTIQAVIEQALKQVLRENISIVGSGRTDSGVHAAAQVANFKTNTKLPLPQIKKAVNAVLPGDIAVRRVGQVPIEFHARFDATSKLYRYTILNAYEKTVFDRDYYYCCPYALDLGLMRKEAKALVGKHDFKSFQAAGKVEKNSVRTIHSIKITKKGSFLYFDLAADGFLHKMVRSIVGTLIDIGRGRFSKGSMNRIIRAKNRKNAGETLPSKGLCLVEVKY